MNLVVTLAKPAASLAAQHLLGIEDEKTRLLKRIDAKVDALLDSPYKAALIHLERAVHATDHPSRNRSLDLAEEKFIDAVAHLERINPFQAAWAALHLTGLARLRGRNDEAVRWVSRACGLAEEALRVCCKDVNDQVDIRRGKIALLPAIDPEGNKRQAAGFVAGTAVVSLVAGATVGILAFPVVIGTAWAALSGYDRYRSRRIGKFQDVLEVMCGFTNEVVELRSTLTDNHREAVRRVVKRTSLDGVNSRFVVTVAHDD